MSDTAVPPGPRGAPLLGVLPRLARGRRLCIGRPLALLEMRLVISTLSREFRPRLVEGQRVAAHAQSTLRSRHGIRMTLAPA